MNRAVIAEVFHITQSMAAGIELFVLPHRLPRNRPVIAGIIVADVNIMPWAVHRHAVRPEARDAVIFRRTVQKIAACRVIEHAIHIADTDVICPRNGQIDTVDHIFAALVVKMAVLHSFSHLISIMYRAAARRRNDSSYRGLLPRQ